MTNDGVAQRTYRQEIESALAKDMTQLGDVFRASLDDEEKTPQDTADELGIDRNGIYKPQHVIKTLTDGRKYTDAPGYALQTAKAIRGFVSRCSDDDFSDKTIAKLLELSAEHDRVASDEEGILRENEQIEQETKELVESGSPGIYVYSYPHYMNYNVIPSDEDDTSSRTYLKVGMSGTDAKKRAKEQQNLTAVPEPIMLLRIYTHSDGDLKEIERKIHNHLNAADHNQVNKERRRGRKRESGEEWFLTHLPFIDSTAMLLGLDTKYAYEEDYSS